MCEFFLCISFTAYMRSSFPAAPGLIQYQILYKYSRVNFLVSDCNQTHSRIFISLLIHDRYSDWLLSISIVSGLLIFIDYQPLDLSACICITCMVLSSTIVNSVSIIHSLEDSAVSLSPTISQSQFLIQTQRFRPIISKLAVISHIQVSEWELLHYTDVNFTRTPTEEPTSITDTCSVVSGMFAWSLVASDKGVGLNRTLPIHYLYILKLH